MGYVESSILSVFSGVGWGYCTAKEGEKVGRYRHRDRHHFGTVESSANPVFTDVSCFLSWGMV